MVVHPQVDVPVIPSLVAAAFPNDEQGRRALVFDDISAADRQRLIHFVFDCQRAALAKTKTSGNAAVQQLP